MAVSTMESAMSMRESQRFCGGFILPPGLKNGAEKLTLSVKTGKIKM
jgi:hypothetical protein